MATSNSLVELKGSDKGTLPEARVLGPVNPGQSVTVTVVLKPSQALADVSHEAGARAMGSVQPMTRQEFASSYAASPASVRKVEDFAHEQGLVVVSADPVRRSIVLKGSAGQMNTAFGTRLESHVLPDGVRHRGRKGALYVPKDLASVVQAVLGLDNRPQAVPHFQLLKDMPGMGGGIVFHGVGQSYYPTELAKLYNFPTESNGTRLDGQGQCVGIIELGGGYVPADLNAYFNELGITPPSIKSVSVDHGRNSPGNAADAEVMLDIEVVGAVAPGASMAVYFAPNTSRGFLDAITTAVHDTKNKPSVISISWGAPESPPYWTQQAVDAYNQAFQEAATLGVTICSASGDNGSGDGATDNLAHVDFPSASPYVLACGGTKLTASNDSITSEVVWNEATDSATGGGVSEIFPLPTWQQSANVPVSVNPGHKKGRGVPDVAGDADPVTGYKVLVNGSDTVIGGTSAVAPLWAGLIALINQSLGQPVGYINPLLYTPPFATAFNDITQGNNPKYKAGPGWDACTGLGSPDGSKLLAALGG